MEHPANVVEMAPDVDLVIDPAALAEDQEPMQEEKEG